MVELLLKRYLWLIDTLKRGGEMTFDEISDKKVVVVKFIDGGKYPDSIVCKRLRKFEKQLTLTSDNPNGRDFEIAPRDVEWLGVVVQLLSNRGL